MVSCQVSCPAVPFFRPHVIFQILFYYSFVHLCFFLGRRISFSSYLLKTIFLSSFNFGVVIGVVWIHSCLYGHTETESAPLFILYLIVFRIFADVWFYTIHRCFHTQLLYPLHKVHHEYRESISFSAFYAHPIENIMANLCLVLIPMHILTPSHTFLHLWFLISVAQSILSHAGDIDLYFIKIPCVHEYHHKYLHCNYGNGCFMDRLMRTTHADFFRHRQRYRQLP